MLALESPQSIFKRSSSIWRRLSKRGERPTKPTHKRMHSEDASVPHKLQKRATEPAPQIQLSPKNILTHVQRVEAPLLDFAPKPASRTRVVASDMQTTAFPSSSSVRTVAWNVFLKPEQVYSLVMGFRPRQMEDKWFIYSEGPDNSGKLKVHFHRSWTGMKIAELFVLIDLKGLGAGKIVGIKWNGTDEANGLEEDEAKYMIETTCSWVLGVKLER
ncbi:hypothetical protein BS50DRAFT_622398 [Corynespora cassiicola Philippines]|uniref:Uncharacterized protein n=1 Tax=Corynespora cassiicola Philippines TaxID=1448308 RepID=A0A2T2NIK9_CORCC|nr:hypothetical protein BS50DRAFT_622398 [Corynespora cassiicola Philippines]